MMNSDRANIRMPLPIASDTVFVRIMMYTLGYPSSSGVHAVVKNRWVCWEFEIDLAIHSQRLGCPAQ